MMKISLKKIAVCILLVIVMYFVWDNVKVYFFEKKYTKLVVALGEDIHQTQLHSTSDLHLNTHKPRETDLFTVAGPETVFEYRDPKLGFSLPPTILVTISTDNSKVKDIVTYPQLVLLNLNDSKQLVKKLIKLFDGIGWVRDPKYHTPNPDDLDDNQFDGVHNHERVVGAWVNGNKELSLGIKRRITKKDLEEHPMLHGSSYTKKPYQDYYLIEVSLYAKALLSS